MADNSRILWGRTFIASLAMELVLGIVTVALFNLQDNPNATLDIVIPILALVLFIPAGKWAAKPAPGSAILNGALAGFWGILMYVLLTLYMRGAVADFDFESSLRPAYMLAHALKVVGGAIGGWLLIRKGA